MVPFAPLPLSTQLSFGLARVALGLALCGVGGFACIRFPAFACQDSQQCALSGLSGSCEDSGYCSFPDTECASGRRYGDEAPPELANTCVDGDVATGGTTMATTTGGSATSMSTLSASTMATDTSAETDDESSTGATPMCIDADGDGFGEGEDCAGPDCDDDNPATSDGCLYVGPAGSDAGAGTAEDPWLTFAHALSQLEPGNSLVVLDGEYEHDVHGVIGAECDVPEANVANGTSNAPIFVRAQTSGQVTLQPRGKAIAIELDGCAWWRVRGFTAFGEDRSREDGGSFAVLLGIFGGSNLEVREVAVVGPNRFFNNHAVFVGGASEVLLEDVAAYDSFRIGFSISEVSNLTCRRCYANSHEVPDLPACPELPECPDPTDTSLTGTADCPKCSAGSATRGDDGFYVRGSRDVLLENCVSELAARGFYVQSAPAEDGGGATRVSILGSLSLSDTAGLRIESDTTEFTVSDVVIEDMVVLDSEERGIWIRSPESVAVRNATVLRSGDASIHATEYINVPCAELSQCGASFEYTLVDGGAEGIEIADLDPWSITQTNVFGSSGADYLYPDQVNDELDDERGFVTLSQSTEPTGVGAGAGQCQVYVPEDSNMKRVDGRRDIGANIVERLVDGMPTGEPLWAPDGQFSCGPVVDVAGGRCQDLHQRARVGVRGCPVPEVPAQ